MRYLLNILFWGMLSSLFYGLYHKSYVDYTAGDRWIGFSVLGLTFIYLPIFLVYRWRGKKLSDYTLTDENFAKMRDEKTRKGE